MVILSWEKLGWGLFQILYDSIFSYDSFISIITVNSMAITISKLHTQIMVKNSGQML